jgi:hypothetical protein
VADDTIVPPGSFSGPATEEELAAVKKAVDERSAWALLVGHTATGTPFVMEAPLAPAPDVTNP